MRYYVYQFVDDYGLPLYIGKGSGDRLQDQIRRFKREGHILNWFKCEIEAYKSEAILIDVLRPPLNKMGGRMVFGKPRETPRFYPMRPGSKNWVGIFKQWARALPKLARNGGHCYLFGEDFGKDLIQVIKRHCEEAGLEYAKSLLAKHGIDLPIEGWVWSTPKVLQEFQVNNEPSNAVC